MRVSPELEILKSPAAYKMLLAVSKLAEINSWLFELPYVFCQPLVITKPWLPKDLSISQVVLVGQVPLPTPMLSMLVPLVPNALRSPTVYVVSPTPTVLSRIVVDTS